MTRSSNLPRSRTEREELLERLEETRAKLEATEDPEAASE